MGPLDDVHTGPSPADLLVPRWFRLTSEAVGSALLAGAFSPEWRDAVSRPAGGVRSL